MSIFKRNLTSEVLEEQSSLVISKQSAPISILEVGCGDGNISLNLAKKFPNNYYFASDISSEAISEAKSKVQNSVVFQVSSGIDFWLDYKFDLVICDVSAISEKIAKISDWYKGVSCKSGVDGMDAIRPIIENVGSILNPAGIFVIPVISLCNTNLQKEILKNVFSSVSYSKEINWPVPKDLLLNMEKESISVDSNFLFLKKKFDLVVASTCAATCYY